ncbi:hypothetical protein B0H13DRAFT_2305237 [Mycena leptocephala]|nr:hypothetical protein B0H13DRAFT_2305237 [Mycena leptocephala]
MARKLALEKKCKRNAKYRERHCRFQHIRCTIIHRSLAEAEWWVTEVHRNVDEIIISANASRNTTYDSENACAANVSAQLASNTPTFITSSHRCLCSSFLGCRPSSHPRKHLQVYRQSAACGQAMGEGEDQTPLVDPSLFLSPIFLAFHPQVVAVPAARWVLQMPKYTPTTPMCSSGIPCTVTPPPPTPFAACSRACSRYTLATRSWADCPRKIVSLLLSRVPSRLLGGGASKLVGGTSQDVKLRSLNHGSDHVYAKYHAILRPELI